MCETRLLASSVSVCPRETGRRLQDEWFVRFIFWIFNDNSTFEKVEEFNLLAPELFI